jgi:hypothetical protein
MSFDLSRKSHQQAIRDLEKHCIYTMPNSNHNIYTYSTPISQLMDHINHIEIMDKMVPLFASHLGKLYIGETVAKYLSINYIAEYDLVFYQSDRYNRFYDAMI